MAESMSRGTWWCISMQWELGLRFSFLFLVLDLGAYNVCKQSSSGLKQIWSETGANMKRVDVTVSASVESGYLMLSI